MQTHSDPFEELFDGMYFVFVRGLVHGKGIVKLDACLKTEEELDHVMRI